MIIEACVETLDQAILAEKMGADQIELCARLDLGGISPSVALVHQVVASIDIPIKIMLRPRAGNFNYTELEMERIQEEIERYQTVAIEGYVFGCLNDDSMPDIQKLARVCSWVGDKSLTFHKAIDACPEIFVGLEYLQDTSVEYVLSSGGKDTAMEGSETLRKMQEQSRIKIIAAGKITQFNLTQIAQQTGLDFFHGRKIVGDLN